MSAPAGAKGLKHDFVGPTRDGFVLAVPAVVLSCNAVVLARGGARWEAAAGVVSQPWVGCVTYGATPAESGAHATSSLCSAAPVCFFFPREREMVFSGWVFFLISFGSPRVRCTPVGRTCGEPHEIELAPIRVELNGPQCVPLVLAGGCVAGVLAEPSARDGITSPSPSRSVLPDQR